MRNTSKPNRGCQAAAKPVGVFTHQSEGKRRGRSGDTLTVKVKRGGIIELLRGSSVLIRNKMPAHLWEETKRIARKQRTSCAVIFQDEVYAIMLVTRKGVTA